MKKLQKSIAMLLCAAITAISFSACSDGSESNGENMALALPAETTVTSAIETEVQETTTAAETEATTVTTTTAAETEATTVATTTAAETEVTTVVTTTEAVTEQTTVTTSFTPLPLTPAALTQELESEILRNHIAVVYREQVFSDSDSEIAYFETYFSDSDIDIAYFGTYNGYVCVQILDPHVHYPCVDSPPFYFDDVIIEINCELGCLFQFYKDGEFIQLREAFEKGFVTSEDFANIDYYHELYWNLGHDQPIIR